MPMAQAALLTTVVSTATTASVEAFIKGQRCWLRFSGANKAAAEATLLRAHAQKMQAFADLAIPGIDRNTRVLLDIRLTVEPVAGARMPTYEASAWSCPPVAATRPQMSLAA